VIGRRRTYNLWKKSPATPHHCGSMGADKKVSWNKGGGDLMGKKVLTNFCSRETDLLPCE